jgi:hypothetical protein
MKIFLCTYLHPNLLSKFKKTISLVLEWPRIQNLLLGQSILPSTIIIFGNHVITQANPDGFILLKYCSTHDQVTDIITKPVQDDIFFKLRKHMLGW